LRKYFGFKKEDFSGIDTEEVNFLINAHTDEVIKQELNLFGAFGTDLTNPETGGSWEFYRNWVDEKRKEAQKYEEEETPLPYVPKEVVEKRKAVFDSEIMRIVGARKFSEEAVQGREIIK